MTKRFKGMAYPITKHPKGFFRNADTDVEEIKSAIAAIVMTEPNERIFEPWFGVDLKGVSINGPKEIVESQFRVRIASAIKRWEKRVQVQDITTKVEAINGNIVLMIVVYFIDPIDIRTTHDVTLYKSLGEANGRNLPF